MSKIKMETQWGKRMVEEGKQDGPMGVDASLWAERNISLKQDHAPG